VHTHESQLIQMLLCDVHGSSLRVHARGWSLIDASMKLGGNLKDRSASFAFEDEVTFRSSFWRMYRHLRIVLIYMCVYVYLMN
jgi:hypothetical protein